MSQIASLLPTGNILLDLDAGSKARLFDAVGALFEANRGLVEKGRRGQPAGPREAGLDRARARASRSRTVAIRGLAEAQGAFVRLKSPIPFDAPDGKPVAQVFVLLVPEHATEQHLQLLSELAQMFSEARFRESLGSPTDAAGLRAVFDQWEPAA